MRLKMDESRDVQLDPREHPHLDHGYAVTSHSSQGQTAERVLIHVDTELAAKDLLNSRMAYVAVSRGAEDAQLYTNDRAKLPEALGHDVSHESAHTPAMKPEQSITPAQQEIAPVIEHGLGLGHGLQTDESSGSELCLAFKIFTEIENSPARFLHSQKIGYYLQLKQCDPMVLSPAQDDSIIFNAPSVPGLAHQFKGADGLLAHGQALDQVGANFVAAAWRIGHCDFARGSDFYFRLNDVFGPITRRGRDIAGKGEVLKR
jgi:hypothetical protein